MAEGQTVPETLQRVIQALTKLSDDDRSRIVQTVITFFNIGTGISIASREAARGPRLSISEDISAKEFISEKEPRTDVERVACLGFFLSHHRGQPHFNTSEISQLNTEAAQPKFSNAAYSVSNATQSGLLAPGSQGRKQLTSMGEKFVMALPDRAAAMAARTSQSRRRGRLTPKKKHAKGEV